MADFKIGANGDLSISLNTAGDIVLKFTDPEAISEQDINIAIHPQALGQALVGVLGGAPWSQSLVNFLITELTALVPKA